MKKALTFILVALTLLLVYTRFVEQMFFDTSNIIIKNEKISTQLNNFNVKIIANSLLSDDSFNQVDGQVSLINDSSSDAVVFAGNNFTQSLSEENIGLLVDKYKTINVKYGKFYYLSEYEGQISKSKLDLLTNKLQEVGFIDITNKSRSVNYRGKNINFINTSSVNSKVEIKPELMNLLFYTSIESEINNLELLNNSQADFTLLVKNPKYLFKLPFIYDPFGKISIPNQVVNGVNAPFDQPFRFGSTKDAKNIILQKQ